MNFKQEVIDININPIGQFISIETLINNQLEELTNPIEVTITDNLSPTIHLQSTYTNDSNTISLGDISYFESAFNKSLEVENKKGDILTLQIEYNTLSGITSSNLLRKSQINTEISLLETQISNLNDQIPTPKVKVSYTDNGEEIRKLKTFTINKNQLT